jgi:hypothetical protein
MYVSCQYAPPDETGMSETKEAGKARITCIDDQGRTWWLTENSDVGDWLEFKASGGTVAPYAESEET